MTDEEIETKRLTIAKMDKEILVKLKVIDDLAAIVDNTKMRIQVVERLELELQASNRRIRALEEKKWVLEKKKRGIFFVISLLTFGLLCLIHLIYWKG